MRGLYGCRPTFLLGQGQGAVRVSFLHSPRYAMVTPVHPAWQLLPYVLLLAPHCGSYCSVHALPSQPSGREEVWRSTRVPVV